MAKRKRSSAGKRSAKLGLRECRAIRHSGVAYTSTDGREVAAREITWDTEQKGLGLRVYPSGRKSWVLRFRYRGRTRMVDLGDFPGLLPESAGKRQGARQLAQIAVGRLAAGLDPFPPKAKGRTFVEIQEDVLEELGEGRKGRAIKASTLGKYQEGYRLIVEELGWRVVDELDEAAVRRAWKAWRTERGPAAANHALRLLRETLRVAAALGARDRRADDPTAGIEYAPGAKRGIQLSPEQYAALGEALDREADLHADRADCVNAIRLLAITGCRRREITALRWSEVDLGSMKLRLADSKTGKREVALSTNAAAILASLPRDTDRVFPDDRHEVGFAIQYTWKRVRQAAELPADTRLHDLRHSFVTTGLAANFSEALVGKAVGHSSPATTRRYSHLTIEPARQVAERVGGDVAAKLAGRPTAETTVMATRAKR